MQILLTGFPDMPLGRAVLSELLADPNVDHIHCIVRRSHQAQAQGWFQKHAAPNRVSSYEGDPSWIDMGLSGAEFSEIAAKVQVIHHCATPSDTTMAKREAFATCGGAARELVEWAEAAHRLNRLVYWSPLTTFEAFKGTIDENTDPVASSKDTPIIRALVAAENRIWQARAICPVAVMRFPEPLVIEEKTEPMVLEGLHLITSMILRLSDDFAVPRLGSDTARLYALPARAIAQAGVRLAHSTSQTSERYHLVPSEPIRVHEALGLIAKHAGKRVERPSLRAMMLGQLLRLSMMRWLAPGPKAALDRLLWGGQVKAKQTEERLLGLGFKYPTFQDVAPLLIASVRQYLIQHAEPQGGMLKESFSTLDAAP